MLQAKGCGASWKAAAEPGPDGEGRTECSACRHCQILVWGWIVLRAGEVQPGGVVWAASALLCLWRTPASVLPWLPCPLLRLWHCCEHSVLPAVFLQGCVSSWSPLLAAEKPALLCWASTLRLPPPKHIACKPARGTCSKEAGVGFDFPLWLWGWIFVQAPAENKLDFGKVSVHMCCWIR